MSDADQIQLVLLNKDTYKLEKKRAIKSKTFIFLLSLEAIPCKDIYIYFFKFWLLMAWAKSQRYFMLLRLKIYGQRETQIVKFIYVVN